MARASIFPSRETDMSNEAPDDTEGKAPKGRAGSARPDGGACEEGNSTDELPRFPEHLRQAILESEARILARWKKRGLFGLTTSTG